MAAETASLELTKAGAAMPYIGYNALFWSNFGSRERILRTALADAAGDGNLAAVLELLKAIHTHNFGGKDFLSAAIIRAAGSGASAAKQILSALFAGLCSSAAADVVQEAMLKACEEGNPETVAFLAERFYVGKAPAGHLKRYLLSVRAKGSLFSVEDKWWSLSEVVFGGNVKEGLDEMGKELTGQDFEILMTDSSPAEIIFMLEILGVTKEQACLHALKLVSDFDTMKSLYSFYQLKFWDVYISESFHPMCWRGHLGVAKFMFDSAALEIKHACGRPDSEGARWLADNFGPDHSYEYYLARWAKPIQLVIYISRTKREEFKLHVLKWILSVFPPQEATIEELIEGGPTGFISRMKAWDGEN